MARPRRDAAQSSGTAGTLDVAFHQIEQLPLESQALTARATAILRVNELQAVAPTARREPVASSGRARAKDTDVEACRPTSGIAALKWEGVR